MGPVEVKQKFEGKFVPLVGISVSQVLLMEVKQNSGAKLSWSVFRVLVALPIEIKQKLDNKFLLSIRNLEK